MTVRCLSARRAREILDAAELVKAPDWRESRAWHVVSGGRLLVIVSPSYGGTGRSGRNGWQWRLADGPGASQPEPTREKAAVAGLAAWQRRATNSEK